MPETLRVLTADDHPLFRDGLRTLLASAPDAELVGEATNGEEAVSLVAEAQPDVVVMDLQMPGMGGIEATRRIVSGSPHVRVLVVTMFDDDATVFSAMRAGARGYVLKGANYREMLRAIRAVGEGEAIFSPAVAVLARGLLRQQHPPQRPARRFPRAIRAGARDPRPPRARPEEPRDRRPPLPQPQDRPKQRLQHPRQVAGRGQDAGRHPRPRGRAGVARRSGERPGSAEPLLWTGNRLAARG
jgi:DNA-binding NarL/FixJ family response regulator